MSTSERSAELHCFLSIICRKGSVWCLLTCSPCAVEKMQIQNISYACSFRTFRMRWLPYENKMHAKGTKQVKESAAVSDCTKMSCVRKVGQPRIRKLSTYEIFWIYSTCNAVLVCRVDAYDIQFRTVKMTVYDITFTLNENASDAIQPKLRGKP